MDEFSVNHINGWDQCKLFKWMKQVIGWTSDIKDKVIKIHQ